MEHALPRSFSDDAWKNSLRSRHRPRNCVWELTLGCNLSCLHCGSSAGRARRDELTTDQCLDLVDQLADLGCELITLSGGEPMLRPDLYDIARAIADRGIRVNMVSPGQLENSIDLPSDLPGVIPMGRAGTVRELVRTVLWIASDEAAYVTGQDLDIAGGLML